MSTENGATGDDPAGHGPADDESYVRELWGGPTAEERAPEALRRSSRAAYGLRRVGATLADLTDDSVFADGRRAGPCDDEPRYLTFRADSVAIRIEVTAHARHRVIVGQVTPTGPADVMVHWPRGRTRAEVDPDGGFIAAGVPPGPISLTIRRPATPEVTTRWTRV